MTNWGYFGVVMALLVVPAVYGAFKRAARASRLRKANERFSVKNSMLDLRSNHKGAIRNA